MMGQYKLIIFWHSEWGCCIIPTRKNVKLFFFSLFIDINIENAYSMKSLTCIWRLLDLIVLMFCLLTKSHFQMSFIFWRWEEMLGF